MQSHYLNLCWNIVNCTLRNKLQWNLNRNSYIFIQENAFENVVWKEAAILFWPQCVKSMLISHCSNIYLFYELRLWYSVKSQRSNAFDYLCSQKKCHVFFYLCHRYSVKQVFYHYFYWKKKLSILLFSYVLLFGTLVYIATLKSSYYQNECWVDNWNLSNKLRWSLSQNIKNFFYLSTKLVYENLCWIDYFFLGINELTHVFVSPRSWYSGM